MEILFGMNNPNKKRYSMGSLFIAKRTAAPKAWLIFAVAAFALLTGCTDPNRIIDENTSIVNHNWSYGNKVKYNVDIQNPTVGYNLYLNVRVTANYKYSNMFVLVYQSGGAFKKTTATRYEIKLASPTGEWLGKGSGSMYGYQVSFKTNYRFPAKGKYHFEIEQNMRDNPLRAVSDVGLRVEKAE
jgi:gliding motility-associated lipoprotein GldH